MLDSPIPDRKLHLQISSYPAPKDRSTLIVQAQGAAFARRGVGDGRRGKTQSSNCQNKRLILKKSDFTLKKLKNRTEYSGFSKGDVVRSDYQTYNRIYH